MNIQSRPTMTIDAFFDWSQGQERKYELVDGVPRMLPWVTRNHSTIVSNLDFALQSRLDRDLYVVRQGDFAVATGPSSIRYADVLVEPSGGQGHERTTERAIFIAEVLSESTTHVDFGPKREEYLGLAGLDTYLIFSQDKPQAWQWTRGTEGEWPTDPVLIESGSIEIGTIRVSFDLAELYHGVL